jgi:hypothetical protein
MKKISSPMTTFHKKVFPAFWFGFLGLVLIGGITQGTTGNGNRMFLLIPCVMALFGYVMMRKLIWDLVDEVYDGGDFLVVKNRGRAQQVPLTDVMNVSSSTAMNPPRITLRLRGASASGPLGSEFSFSPIKAFTLNPFAKSAVAEDLIVRVDKARRAHPES